MKLDFNSLFTSSYRWLAICFLTIIFAVAGSYGVLVSFYFVNESWIAPINLSPSQDQVLSFQPQVAALEAQVDKQKVDLATTLSTGEIAVDQLKNLNTLISKVDSAIKSESRLQDNIASQAAALAKEKRSDIISTQKAISEARSLLKAVDDELAAKLITSDQAAQRRISLQAAINSATDAHVSAMQLETQAAQMRSGAATLAGGSSSLLAITAVKQLIELKAMQAQLQIQATTAAATAKALQRSLTNAERVLEVARSSPYYRALREKITIAFGPYENLKNVRIGDPIYDCYLQIIGCRKVGSVKIIYEAEEHAHHPLFKSDIRGRLIEIDFTDPAASQSMVIFVGRKPLLL